MLEKEVKFFDMDKNFSALAYMFGMVVWIVQRQGTYRTHSTNICRNTAFSVMFFIFFSRFAITSIHPVPVRQHLISEKWVQKIGGFSQNSSRTTKGTISVAHVKMNTLKLNAWCQLWHCTILHRSPSITTLRQQAANIHNFFLRANFNLLLSM